MFIVNYSAKKKTNAKRVIVFNQKKTDNKIKKKIIIKSAVGNCEKYCPCPALGDSDIASFSQENHLNMAPPKVSITDKFAMSPIEHIESLNKLLLHNTTVSNWHS